jgi:acetyl esterase/lipase
MAAQSPSGETIMQLAFSWAFRRILLLPDKVLLKLCGQSPRRIGGKTLDARAQFHAWFIRRFRKPIAIDPVELRKPRLLSLALLDDRPVAMRHLADRAIPGPAGPIPMRLYQPHSAPDGAPILVYFHFGGCVLGDLETCHTACSLIADHARCIVLSVDYRLAPEHKYPAALDDAIAAYQWALANAQALGGDPALVGVGGDSAGGYLAAALSLALIERQQLPPRLQVLIYPVMDMNRKAMPETPFDDAYPLSRADMIWFAEQYLNHPDEADEPLCSVERAKSLGSLPLTVMALAGHDVLHDEGEAFARRLTAQGVPVWFKSYDTLPHAFTAMSGAVPAARAAILEIADLTAQAFASLTHSRQGAAE